MVDSYELGSDEHGAQFLMGRLMQVARRRFCNLAVPWHELSEQEQSGLLHGLNADLEDVVRDAVKIIAGHARISFRAEVDSVQFKGATDIKATLKLVNGPEAHSLADTAGAYVTVLIEDIDELLSVDPGELKGEPDNKPLFDESTNGRFRS